MKPVLLQPKTLRSQSGYKTDLQLHYDKAQIINVRSWLLQGNDTAERDGLKSQVVYSKQPKLGLTQEFVVDCAHALWVVHSIKRLVSLMLLKWFLSDSFIYFMYRMFNENF